MTQISLVKTLIRTTPLIHRDSTPSGILKRAKYCLRGLAFAGSTREWFKILQTPEMAVIIKNYPGLYHKLQRPYLNRIFNTRQRLNILKQHYKFVFAHFSNFMIESIYTSQGKLLCELAVEEFGVLELRLAYSGKQKEGELSINLVNKSTKRLIASLSFSVSRYETDCKEIFIGGLQGDKSATKETVVAITRALHGLRPKALLVYVVHQLATAWGMTRLRAVSDDKHIYRHFQKRREVSAAYDEFWIESGGSMAEDGIFDLSVSFVSRDISTIRVNKRQMYKRRYAMLAEAAAQIKNQLQGKAIEIDTKIVRNLAVNDPNLKPLWGMSRAVWNWE